MSSLRRTILGIATLAALSAAARWLYGCRVERVAPSIPFAAEDVDLDELREAWRLRYTGPRP